MIMERDVLIQTHKDGFLNKIPRWWFQMFFYFHPYLDVSVLIGLPPNHPFLIGFSIINHPFWGTHYFWKHPLGEDVQFDSYEFRWVGSTQPSSLLQFWEEILGIQLMARVWVTRICTSQGDFPRNWTMEKVTAICCLRLRLHPWKLIWNILPWRFGSDHFPFFSWVTAVGSSRYFLQGAFFVGI